MNKALLYGNVGGDPKITNLESGKKVAKFSLATNKTYSNSAGEKITETQWHNIVLWGKLAETAEKYVKKGSSLIVEGEINYRSYENKDGITIYVTEINGQNMHFAGSKPEETPKSNKVQVSSMSDISELPGNVANYDEIPDDNLPY